MSELVLVLMKRYFAAVRSSSGASYIVAVRKRWTNVECLNTRVQIPNRIPAWTFLSLGH